MALEGPLLVHGGLVSLCLGPALITEDSGPFSFPCVVPGIGYSVVRVPMASCDFSTRLYTYADTPGDYDLKSFALAPEDVKMKVSVFTLMQKLVHLLMCPHQHPLPLCFRSLCCSVLRPCPLSHFPCWAVPGAPPPG